MNRHDLLSKTYCVFKTLYFWGDTLLQRSVTRIQQMLTGIQKQPNALVAEPPIKDNISGLSVTTAERQWKKHTEKATSSYAFFFGYMLH